MWRSQLGKLRVLSKKALPSQNPPINYPAIWHTQTTTHGSAPPFAMEHQDVGWTCAARPPEPVMPDPDPASKIKKLFFVPVLCAPKNGYPQESRPRTRPSVSLAKNKLTASAVGAKNFSPPTGRPQGDRPYDIRGVRNPCPRFSLGIVATGF